nr:Type 1 glutamine amidotransferase-like domain-containing protein [Motilibacter aurantiacus]
MLLTSAGLTNETLCESLAALSGRPLPSLALAVIPTAANVIPGDKGWLIADYVRFQRAGFSQVDIVDISALRPEIWRPRLEEADVLAVSGGDTTHLLRSMRGTGLSDVLAELLDERVYLGVSAGSMVTGPHLGLSRSAQETIEDRAGLALVGFLVQPHLDSPHFPLAAEAVVREAAAGLVETTYALSDGRAVLVDDGAVRVVGDGPFTVIPGMPRPTPQADAGGGR